MPIWQTKIIKEKIYGHQQEIWNKESEISLSLKFYLLMLNILLIMLKFTPKMEEIRK
jgi:hypothetical protein